MIIDAYITLPLNNITLTIFSRPKNIYRHRGLGYQLGPGDAGSNPA